MGREIPATFGPKNEYFDRLREELIRRKAVFAKNRKGENPHLEDINPEELSDEDLKMYGKFKDGSLSVEELVSYREKLVRAHDEAAQRIERGEKVKSDLSSQNLAAMMWTRISLAELSERRRQKGQTWLGRRSRRAA